MQETQNAQTNAQKHQAVLYILYCFDPAILKCTRFPHHWQQCVRMIPNVDGRLSTKVEHHPWHPTIAPYHGTLHSNGVQKKHPLAPCNGTRSTPPMAPGPLPQSWSSPSPPTIAHYNGTLQWSPAMAPRPLPQSWSSRSPPNHSTLLWHPTMAPSNGTTSTAPCNGTLLHVQSAKVVRRPAPLLEVRTPIAGAIWGMILEKKIRSLEKKHVAWKNLQPLEKNLSSFACVVFWSSGPVVLVLGCLVLWSFGPLVLWSSAAGVLWSLWSCSALALWSNGPWQTRAKKYVGIKEAWKEGKEEAGQKANTVFQITNRTKTAKIVGFQKRNGEKEAGQEENASVDQITTKTQNKAKYSIVFTHSLIIVS